MAITTVVSDLGGVLTTPLTAAFEAYAETSQITLEQFFNAMISVSTREGTNPMFRLECGEISQEEFLGGLGAQLTEDLGRPVSIADFPEVWFSHLHANRPMLELMTGLRDAGYRMGVLTNNVREWEPLWRPRLNIDEIFSVVVDSGFVGMRKPDPEIYALCQERLGVAPGEILFIDDVDVNVEAAQAAGWSAIQFTTNEATIPLVRTAVSVV
jgi:putative hydrolase of the HAD superfamily